MLASKPDYPIERDRHLGSFIELAKLASCGGRRPDQPRLHIARPIWRERLIRVGPASTPSGAPTQTERGGSVRGRLLSSLKIEFGQCGRRCHSMVTVGHAGFPGTVTVTLALFRLGVEGSCCSPDRTTD